MDNNKKYTSYSSSLFQRIKDTFNFNNFSHLKRRAEDIPFTESPRKLRRRHSFQQPNVIEHPIFIEDTDDEFQAKPFIIPPKPKANRRSSKWIGKMGMHFSKKLPANQPQLQFDQNYLKNSNQNYSTATTKHIVDDSEYSDEDPEIMFIQQKPMSTSSPRDMFSSGGGSQSTKMHQQYSDSTAKSNMSVPSLLKKSSIGGRFSRVPALNPIVKTQQQISPSNTFSMNGFSSSSNAYKPMMVGVNGYDSIIGNQRTSTINSGLPSNLSLRKNSLQQQQQQKCIPNKRIGSLTSIIDQENNYRDRELFADMLRKVLPSVYNNHVNVSKPRDFELCAKYQQQLKDYKLKVAQYERDLRLWRKENQYRKNLVPKKLDYSQEYEAIGRPVTDATLWKHIFEQPNESVVVEIESQSDSYENPVASPPSNKRSLNLSDLVSEESSSNDDAAAADDTKQFLDFIDDSMLFSSTQYRPTDHSPDQINGIDDIIQFLESYDAPRAGTPIKSSNAYPSPRQMAEDLLSRTTLSPKSPKILNRVRKLIALDDTLDNSTISMIVDDTNVDQMFTMSKCPFSPLSPQYRRHFIDPTPVMRPSRHNICDDDELPVITLSDDSDNDVSASPGNLEASLIEIDSLSPIQLPLNYANVTLRKKPKANAIPEPKSNSNEKSKSCEIINISSSSNDEYHSINDEEEEPIICLSSGDENELNDTTKSITSNLRRSAIGKKPVDIIDLDEDDESNFSKPYRKRTESEIFADLKNSHLLTDPEPIIIPDASEAVIPVNTLKAKIESKPQFHNDWLLSLNNRYSGLKDRRSEAIKEEVQRNEKYRNNRHSINTSVSDIGLGKYYPCEYIEEPKPEVIDDFPAFDEKQRDVIVKATRGHMDEILIEKFNFRISRKDIMTLNWVHLEWLNDEVINFYMSLLTERSQLRENDGYPKVYAMSTFFLTSFERSGYSGVRRWTRKINLFDVDLIPVPVHVGQMHWCMAIINLKEKSIKYYDSMGHPNAKVLNYLSEYLQAESLDKRKIKLDMSDWQILSVPNSPRQQNGSDCGVFSCTTAEFICRNRPLVFNQSNMTYLRQKMVLEIVTGKMLL